MKHSRSVSNAIDAIEPRRRGRRWVPWVAGTLILATCVGEVASRAWLGLGDPPLSIADSEIEYLSKPGTYHRFGNRMFINTRHMRSPEFPEHKQTPDEARVMVLGDSIVHGGGLTDQAELATERLRLRLHEQMGRPVVVGNIAAGSWGPGNQLAYARRFGLFDADVVLIVTHGKDVGDNPSGKPVVGVDASFPAKAPTSALEEAVVRYLIPRLQPFTGQPRAAVEVADAAAEDAAAARSMADLRDLCHIARKAGATVLLAYVPQRQELAGHPLPGHAALAGFAAAEEIEFIDLAAAFGRAVAEGDDPYRPNDPVHPSRMGQKVLCDAVLPVVRKALADHVTPPNKSARPPVMTPES